MARLDLDIGQTLSATCENEIVTAAIEKLQTQISGKFNADILLWELNTLAKEVTPEQWTFTSPGVMIAGAMILLLIGLCCWKKCCQGSQTTSYPMPLALPAPLVFNQHFEPICR
jgi:hypothetical protein